MPSLLATRLARVKQANGDVAHIFITIFSAGSLAGSSVACMSVCVENFDLQPFINPGRRPNPGLSTRVGNKTDKRQRKGCAMISRTYGTPSQQAGSFA